MQSASAPPAVDATKTRAGLLTRYAITSLARAWPGKIAHTHWRETKDEGLKTFVSSGSVLPSVTLGEMQGGELTAVLSGELFSHKRVILIGVPAAFSPICSQLHLPGFVDNAPRLLASGFDMIACIAANDPWVLAMWQKQVDPAGHLRFLSDGNLEFGEACMLTVAGPDYYLGKRIRRFTMIVTDGVVERISVERSGLAVSCTSAAQLGLSG